MSDFLRKFAEGFFTQGTANISAARKAQEERDAKRAALLDQLDVMPQLYEAQGKVQRENDRLKAENEAKLELAKRAAERKAIALELGIGIAPRTANVTPVDPIGSSPVLEPTPDVYSSGGADTVPAGNDAASIFAPEEVAQAPLSSYDDPFSPENANPRIDLPAELPVTSIAPTGVQFTQQEKYDILNAADPRKYKDELVKAKREQADKFAVEKYKFDLQQQAEKNKTTNAQNALADQVADNIKDVGVPIPTRPSSEEMIKVDKQVINKEMEAYTGLQSAKDNFKSVLPLLKRTKTGGVLFGSELINQLRAKWEPDVEKINKLNVAASIALAGEIKPVSNNDMDTLRKAGINAETSNITNMSAAIAGEVLVQRKMDYLDFINTAVSDGKHSLGSANKLWKEYIEAVPAFTSAKDGTIIPNPIAAELSPYTYFRAKDAGELDKWKQRDAELRGTIDVKFKNEMDKTSAETILPQGYKFLGIKK